MRPLQDFCGGFCLLGRPAHDLPQTSPPVPLYRQISGPREGQEPRAAAGRCPFKKRLGGKRDQQFS